jgi:glucosamine 6-phosphate synthetase-like amidotransferase/phosphosugar isomerase protein
MCGIFGFITKSGEGPKIDRLRRIALVTQSRGEHAFGLAWVEANGVIQTFKAPGPAEDHLDELDRCRNAQVVLGHCRYATHGWPGDNRNNHPHPAGKGYFVHNGVIHNHQELISRHSLATKSECDSEVLGQLMARCPGRLIQRSAWAANQACGDLAVLGIWRKPTRLLIVRRGRPLHFGESRDGYYLASLPEGLPGSARSIVDLSAHILTFADGVLHRESGHIDEGPQRHELTAFKRGRIWI